MAIVYSLTFNATTKIWSRTGAGLISYPSTVNAAAGGPYVVNPITIPFDPVNGTGGTFWRLTAGPNVGYLVSAWTNRLGYGDMTITQTGEPTSYAAGKAKINPLAAWRILIKGMGGPSGAPGKTTVTFTASTKIWSRTNSGIISYPSTVNAAIGGPYAVNPIVVPFDPENGTGGSFYRLLEGPNVGFLVSFWTNSLSYGTITTASNAGFNRGPGAVLATLGPGDVVPLPPTGRGSDGAHLAGASTIYNAAGEMHFTLLVDSPFIKVPLPKQTHYAIEFYDTDAVAWVECFAGWIWDMDATDTEVVFYGIDYLAAFTYTVDERFSIAAPDTPAEVGSKYVGQTISQIVTSQLNYAISRPDSIVGFIAVGAIASMPFNISAIYSTMRHTLDFVTGLLDSHRAGTGKETRVSVRKVAGVYTVVVEDDPGVDRNNLMIQYGDLAQGYRAVPFGTGWASRVNFIGRTFKGLKAFYRAESSAIDQGAWGRIAQSPVYVETEDQNDMRRRALQAAIDASRLGKQISVGLRLGSFRPFEGYDVCDNLPVDINHGAVVTKDWGSDAFGTDASGVPGGVRAAFWTILGVTWESYDDGHWMTQLKLFPRGGGKVLPVGPCQAEVPTPSGYYPDMGSPTSDAAGNVMYARPGLSYPTQPTPFYAGSWNFGVYSVADAGATNGRFDSAPGDVINSALCAVVGPGTMTIHTRKGGGANGDGTFDAYLQHSVPGPVTHEFRLNQRAGIDLVFNIPDDGSCYHIVRLNFTGPTGAPTGFDGFDWVLDGIANPSQIIPRVDSVTFPGAPTPLIGYNYYNSSVYINSATGEKYIWDDGTLTWGLVPNSGFLASGLFDFTFGAATVWVVNHTLLGYPRVTLTDGTGAVIEADIVYNSTAQITITFSSAVAGKVHLG